MVNAGKLQARYYYDQNLWFTSHMKKSITVQANQETAWKAIISYRESQPHRRRILSRTAQGVVVEESFTGLPIVGSSRVVYEEFEHPFERIEYRQIEAEHFSEFHGSWMLTSGANGMCEIQLIAEFDIHLEIPFKETILNQLAEMDIDKRLDYVKKTCEESGQ